MIRRRQTMTPLTDNPTANNPITDNPPTPAGEVLVRVEGVGKTFCRDLKKSLWYGVRDIAAERVPGPRRAERRATLLKMLNGLIKPDKGRGVHSDTEGAGE